MTDKSGTKSFWDASNVLFLVAVAATGFGFILVSKIIGLIPDYSQITDSLRWFFSILFKEFGIAAIIASFLGFSVEKFSRAKQHQEQAEFRKQVSENVLSAVFEKIIPPAIYKEIKSTVMEQTLVKKNAHLTYDLQSLPDEVIKKLGLSTEDAANIVFCNIETRHVIENLSENPDVSYVIKCGVSCDLDGLFGEYLEISSVEIEGKKLSQDDLNEFAKPAKDGGVIELKYPRPLAGEEKISVIVHSRTIKRLEDTEVWTTMVPTENMTLEVIHEGNLCIGANANHSKKLKAISLNPSIPKAVFELHHGVLPHQGITFWWRKCKPIAKAPVKPSNVEAVAGLDTGTSKNK
ncbi:hypothetical protein [Arsukibacterium perlucidum]|uniref:hypothetical protein n=1 Tax=Arsukibacterium perlucidum TaxID=368811 RepID=UPI00037DDA53|nr:hypothetical protein [Arsukibacterium perlucidum]